MAAPTIVLCMIVKNESVALPRLLQSVLPIIDMYCICDTGSTDTTVQVVEEFMAQHGKKGRVFSEPFRDFGYNRTVALKAAAEWGTYALLLDADMILKIDPSFRATDLVYDGYRVMQRGGDLEYYNLRLVKTSIGARCVGPTHEYYDLPGGATVVNLNSLWIEDIGDGGCKTDKFERDIRLLTAALVDEPHNPRTHFYLANSYRDVGNLDKAIEHYKKRVECGGWHEEVFCACCELGRAYMHKGDETSALVWWMEAYNQHPGRAESLYEIVKYYRTKGKHMLAQLFLDAAKTITYPRKDVLFVKPNVYNYLLDFEQSILAFYTHRAPNRRRMLELMGVGAVEIERTVLSNYRFYAPRLDAGFTDIYDFSLAFTHTARGKLDRFVCSTPCIIPYKDGYLMNVRCVNYAIGADGSYHFQHTDGAIITINCAYELDRDLHIQHTHKFEPTCVPNGRYWGVEDVRIYPRDDDTLLFLGTVEAEDGRLTIGHGVYDRTRATLNSTPYKSPHGRACEKNWVYAAERGIVYEWSPLTIYDNEFNDLIVRDTTVPGFFRHVRGSTCGVRVNGDMWFLCHVVDGSRSPRRYYHLFVVLDGVTLAYKKHSLLFTFTGAPIEYALGLVIEPSRILISYSVHDASSYVAVLSRAAVNDLF